MGKNPFIHDDDGDIGSGIANTSLDEPYRGPERRSGNDRRKSHDRREEIRFELEKEDRRSGKDRRKSNRWGDIQIR